MRGKRLLSQKKLISPPPNNFTPAGVVESVEFSPVPPPFIKDTRRRGRRGEGLRYEKKVKATLLEMFPDSFIPGPWFRFWELGKARQRWCQPDGLIISPRDGIILLLEIKLQHTAAAWWQLQWLYLPVIAKAFPPDLWNFRLCEIVRWFDPATAFPVRTRLVPDVLAVDAGQFGVHIMKE